jgi:hypothetical protein
VCWCGQAVCSVITCSAQRISVAGGTAPTCLATSRPWRRISRSPSYLPASSASLRRITALISSGAYSLPRTSKRAMPSGPGTTSNEAALASPETSS